MSSFSGIRKKVRRLTRRDAGKPMACLKAWGIRDTPQKEQDLHGVPESLLKKKDIGPFAQSLEIRVLGCRASYRAQLGQPPLAICPLARGALSKVISHSRSCCSNMPVTSSKEMVRIVRCLPTRLTLTAGLDSSFDPRSVTQAHT